jgi:hypothetical protein
VEHEPASFNRPRTIGGLLLIAAAVVLVTVDAISETFTADNVTLALFLGTSSVLLGVEGIRKYLGGQD